ncbi:MAG: DUF3592 domain-containing protein [Candidatus Omnitrophota bacterium]|jgi:hypothetical protein
MAETKPLPENIKIIFGICLIFIGLVAILGGNQIQKIKDALASSSWPQTEGKIISSRVESKTNTNYAAGRTINSAASYFADISYEYTVGDIKYSSKKISFGDYGNSDYSRAEEIINRYPEGKKIQVFYKLSDPNNSVLEPGIPISIYVFIGAGVLLLIFGSNVLYLSLIKNPTLKQ